LKTHTEIDRQDLFVIYKAGIILFFLLTSGCYRTLPVRIRQITPTININTTIPVDTNQFEKPSTRTTVPPSGQVTLMAVGDLMLNRSIGELIIMEGPLAPFSQVDELFEKADWVVANLECAITNSENPERKRYTFKAPLESATGLAEAGINIINLSNNHSLDYGPTGLFDTIDALRQNNINTFGVGRNAQEARTPLILLKNGLTIAMLSYTDVSIEASSYFDTREWIANDSQPGLAWAYLPDVQADVVKARELADLVIVYFHYGVENLDHASQIQHRLATGAIDAGAKLVLGSHTHRLQEIEHYKGGLIIYGLGNFVFDGFDGNSNLTAVLSVRLSKSGVLSYSWYPMDIEDGIPQPAGSESSKVILSLTSREYKVFPPGIEVDDANE
jgi:hypothetical protein